MNLVGRSFGHIRVDRILGQGGMGDVYEGFDERLARRVALKVLNSEGRLDEEARARLIREARTLSKLDHPNICRIHDFIVEGDSDVLVLELIDGRTLQEAMNDGLSSADKLRIARDIASVLVAAHRAGIIHRDLKPENVMLTKSGQVKVLDFGLARWLKRKSGKSYQAISPVEAGPLLHVSDNPETTAVYATPPRPIDDAKVANATAIGLTVGTPLFMSPEQARGEPLTTASDIYSFGLMLQAMFTGKEPYPSDLNAREIMIRASRGESLPVNGIRRDVAALIKTLKAFAPSDRPTAGDTLRRIDRIIATPKRIARRAAVAALIALFVFAGWKYTTDLRRERTAAQAAEAEARQRRAQADSLIEFMLGDLRTKLEPVGRLDVLDAVAERSLAYMSSLDTTRLSPQEIARNSKALSQLGEVRMSQGNLPVAIQVFNKSLALAETAAQRDRTDPEIALGVGTAHYWVGNALRLKGDLPGALTHMREYRRIAEDLAGRYPAKDEFQVERAYGHSTVGTILEAQGDLAGALEEYKVTLAVKSARLAGAPSDTKRQGDVALTLNKIGYILVRLGRFGEARDYYAHEFAIDEDLVRSEPKNTLWKERLATNHAFQADIAEAVGDVSVALAQSQAAIGIYRPLVAHDATNVNWRRYLLLSLEPHANYLRLNGSTDAALRDIAEAETIVEQLLARDASRAQWKTDFARVETVHARILLQAHRASAAEAKLDAAMKIYRGLGSLKGITRVRAADAHLLAGDLASTRGDLASAARSWESAYDIVAKPKLDSDPRGVAVAAQALLRLGRGPEAQPLIDRLHFLGYGQGDFERSLQHHQ